MGVQEGRRAAKPVEVGVFFGHSITTSARPRSVTGPVMPRALMSDSRPSPCFQSLIPALLKLRCGFRLMLRTIPLCRATLSRSALSRRTDEELPRAAA
jgi:hypothetical protein